MFEDLVIRYVVGGSLARSLYGIPVPRSESEVTLYANPFGQMDYDEMSAA